MEPAALPLAEDVEEGVGDRGGRCLLLSTRVLLRDGVTLPVDPTGAALVEVREVEVSVSGGVACRSLAADAAAFAASLKSWSAPDAFREPMSSSSASAPLFLPSCPGLSLPDRLGALPFASPPDDDAFA